MKSAPARIPSYPLKTFRPVHRHDRGASPFGHDRLDPAKAVEGFELYSSEGLVPVAGPLKSDFYRVSITVTGTLDMQIGLDHYTHQPRTLAFTAPGQIFSKSRVSADASGYYLLFDADFLGELLPASSLAEDFPFFSVYGTPLFQVSAGELDAVLALVMRLNGELQQRQAGQGKALQMCLYLLLLEAKRSYERQRLGESGKPRPAAHTLAGRFKRLVGRHYLTARQVGDYARMLGVSASHLNKAVRHCTGQTASEAIREMLLQEAKVRLLHTGASVAEIAYALDFSEPAAFSRFFKAATGQTPQAFRTSPR